MKIERIEKIFFKNTHTEEVYDNNIIAYRIIPNEGYVLHTIYYDRPVFDEDSGEPTEEIIKGYTKSHIALNANYNFELNPYDIYAFRLEDEDNE